MKQTEFYDPVEAHRVAAFCAWLTIGFGGFVAMLSGFTTLLDGSADFLCGFIVALMLVIGYLLRPMFKEHGGVWRLVPDRKDEPSKVEAIYFQTTDATTGQWYVDKVEC